jgi:hypothetical protein
MGLDMKYFVLKPRGSTPFSEASRAGMRAYAEVIESHDRELAEDLTGWADHTEQMAALESEDEK